MKITFIFSCSGMFRNVPECSGMFRNVPASSGMFHVPGFIDAQTKVQPADFEDLCNKSTIVLTK